MAEQAPLAQVFLVSMWLESLAFGFLLCLFIASVYVNLTLRRHQDTHGRIMFGIGIFMFILASIHVSMNCYRMIQGYVIHAGDPGGSVAWIGALSPWHHIFKDTIYATQETLGDAVAVYRTWIIWTRDWRVIAPSCCLIIGSIVSGYTVCGLYPTETAASSIFDPRLLHWITAFYAVSFTQSIITTTLMAYRIWKADRRGMKYGRTTSESNLFPIMRILIESAALQMVVEFVLLVLYAVSNDAQYILLELVTPSVAITFNAITIRIALRSEEALSSFGSRPSPRGTGADRGAAPTFGSIPMRPIAINIHKNVEEQADGRSDIDDRADYATESKPELEAK